jgi:hypothetical protein
MTDRPIEAQREIPALANAVRYRSEVARLNRATDREINETPRRCPIENPYACLGARCQLFGICEHNRRLDGRPLSMAGLSPSQGGWS